MRVKLLLNPYYRVGVNDGLPRTDVIYLPPLGIATLTSFLRKQGIDTSQDDLLTRVYHHNRNHTDPSSRIHIEKFYEPDRIETFIQTGSESELEKEGAKILALTDTEGFDVFGLSIYETYNRSTIAAALVLAKLFKERYDAHVVMGGDIRDEVVPTMLRTGWIDYRINRDDYGSMGDVNLLNFCRMVEGGQGPRDVAGITYWRDEQIIVNPPATQRDGFSRPTFEGLPLELYRKKVTVVESPWTIHSEEALVLPYFFIRGCPNRCAFCSCSTEPFWRAKKPKQVAEDLAFLSEQYATSNFYFLNSGFNPTYRYTDKVCQAIRAEGVRLHWSDCVNVRNLDKRLIEQMRRSGASRLIFGMESASPKILSAIGKPVDPNEVEAMIRLAHEMGIWCEIEIICGFPHESDLDVSLTIDFIKRNQKYLRNVNLFKFWIEGLYRTEPERFGIRFRSDKGDQIEIPGNKTEFDEEGGLTWEQRESATEKSFERLSETQKLLNRDISLQSGMEPEEALFLLCLEDGLESLANVRLTRIDALIKSGRSDEALEACEEAIELIRGLPDKHARIHCRRGRVYREQGRYDDAAAAYREALELKPKERGAIGEIEQGLAETELARGRVEEALALYESRIENADEPEMLADSHLGRIRVLIRSRRTEEALKACEEAFGLVRDLPDKHAQILCTKAELCRWLGGHDEAADAYLEAIELETEERGITWKAEQGLAEIELARGREDEALVLYEKQIIEIDEPEALADAHLGRIEALTRLSRAEEALEACEEAIGRAKDQPNKLARILCSRGRVYLGQERHDEAEASYREALELESKARRAAWEVGQGLAEIAVAQGREDEALALYEEQILKTTEPEALADAHLGRIEALIRSGRAEEALEVCEEALGLIQDLPDKRARILCLKAGLYLGLERRDEAAAAYREALDLEPKEKGVAWKAEQGLAEAALASERKDEVPALHERQIPERAEPEVPADAHLGQIEERIESDRAEEAPMARGKALGPVRALHEKRAEPETLADEHVGRIEELIGSDRAEEALEACGEALDQIRGLPDKRARILSLKAELCHGLGRCDEATAAYREALDLEPEDSWVVWKAEQGLAEIGEARIGALNRSGRTDEALEACEEALSLVPGLPEKHARILCAKAALYQEKESYDEAAAAFRKAFELNPADNWAAGRVERGLAEIAEARIDGLTKSGRTDDALEACEEALGLVRGFPDKHARILCCRANLYLKVGQKKKALELYSDIREKWADRPEIVVKANHFMGRIYSEMGMEALNSGSVERALRHCRQGEEFLRAADDGSHMNAHYLALCLFMMKLCHEVCGDTEEALLRSREVEVLLRAADGDDTFFKELEDLFMRYRNCEAAIDYVREAVKICGATEGAVQNLALLWGSLVRWYRELGRCDEAMGWVAEELSRHPGEPILIFHQGELFMEKGDHERAIRALREAINIQPKIDWAHFSLGKCLYLAGDYQGALAEFEADLAVCRDPLSHFHSWYFKAMVHERMGNREEARACLERAKGYREFAGICEIPEEKEFLREWEAGE